MILAGLAEVPVSSQPVQKLPGLLHLGADLVIVIGRGEISEKSFAALYVWIFATNYLDLTRTCNFVA